MKRNAELKRRTPLRSTKPMQRARSTKAPGQRKRLKAGKVPPTAAESRWMAAIAELGCVVCIKFHQARTPAAVHHIVEGGRRLGHMFTIPLCDPGHHQNTPTPLKVSRHPNKARFEREYGTEMELLAYTQELVGEMP